MRECAHCGTPLDPEARACPNCGRAQEETTTHWSACRSGWERGLAPIRRYFEDLWQIITHPSAFFRRMPLANGVSGPLAFALITHWVGTAVSYLWRSMIAGTLGQYFEKFAQIARDVAPEVDDPGRSATILSLKAQAYHWLIGAGSVVIDPFLTLVGILFTSFFVFLGARLLVTPGRNGAPREITYESALRIVCFGMSPAILAALPLVGGFISAICIVIVTVVGAREVYRTDTGRAIVVALFPKLLFLGIMLFGALVFLIIGFKFLSMLF